MKRYFMWVGGARDRWEVEHDDHEDGEWVKYDDTATIRRDAARYRTMKRLVEKGRILTHLTEALVMVWSPVSNTWGSGVPLEDALDAAGEGE